jgi:predicted HTH transcriptional regulator
MRSFIEAGGRGIQNIAHEYQVAGLPVPEYRNDIGRGKRNRTRIARMTRMHTDTIYRFSYSINKKKTKE